MDSWEITQNLNIKRTANIYTETSTHYKGSVFNQPWKMVLLFNLAVMYNQLFSIRDYMKIFTGAPSRSD